MDQCFLSKILFAWLLCFAALAWGQDETIGGLLQETPQCAVPCFLNVVPSPTCLSNVGQLSSCVCTNHTLLTDLSSCVRLSCELPDQSRSKTLLDQLCQAFPQESQQMTLLLISILTIALSVPSIAFRWWARSKSSKLGWDDYTALAAALLLLTLAALQLESVSLGFGRHVWDVNPANAIPLLQYYWVSQQLYALVQLLIQVSTLALYARIFPVRWFQLTVRTGIIIFIVQDVIFIFLIVLRCFPISAIWDVRVSGRCLNLNLIGLAGAILHISEHFVLLVLPLFELWKLNLSRRKKVQLLLVFTLGSFSCVTSVIRLKYVAIFAPTADASWDTVPVVIWSVIEDLSAVLCINLPPCRHFIGKLFPRQLLTSKGGSHATQSKSMTSSSKRAEPFGADYCGSVTTVVSGGRPSSKKGYMSGATSWLESPLPSPPPLLRNYSLKAQSVMLVKDEGKGFEPLIDMRVTRPYSAGVAHRLDVEIDRSELGLREVLQRKQAGSQQST